MFKNLMRLMTVMAVAFGLSGCFWGKAVEIPTAYVGVIQTKAGINMDQDVRTPSKFRLDWALPWGYKDRLIVLDVSDEFYSMKFDTFMPRDELMLKYSVEMTMRVKPSKYKFVFQTVPFKAISNQFGVIDQKTVYKRYAQAKLKTVIPSIMANYSIKEIASSSAEINKYITEKLNQELVDTPFAVKIAGATDFKYPETITTAQIKSAERRQQEDTVRAQRKLDLLTVEIREEVSKKERSIELYEAETKSIVARKLVTDEFKFLEEQKTLRLLAEGTNKVFVPVSMLDNISHQTPVK